MQISINGFTFSTKASDTTELRAEFFTQDSEISAFIQKHDLADADIFILNGFAIKEQQELKDNDKITLIKRGVMPEREILKAMIEARNSPELNAALNSAIIGVAGLGGLGSNIALSLARVGVSRLILADFDVVEPSNLNRQQYFVSHIGMKKVEATKELITQVNPFVEVITHDVYLDAKNVAEIFAPCSIICEAFDNVIGKTMFLNEASASLASKQIITASGMAGFHSSNIIKTMKFAKNVYVCGDLKNEARIGQGLMAPRVAICANHQANLALRLLMGLEA
ncbi:MULTISPECIES: sulfur carrier protein ThiS adenylyltransferase ThiF [unclassified Campylobacter]|uniref:sulfur carrier protein ThiS adenylyltransferase ThiF n=1 Tax=unclassified Campylobacter TaxID=2593542 RepID=UPI003D34F6D8